ncbi:MAG: hypothetical protein ABII79_13025 [bacterium]
MRYFILALVGCLLLTGACVQKRADRSPARESAVTVALKEMVAEDQRLRTDATLDYSIVRATDQKHHEKIFELLAQGRITQAADLYRAALLLQHADPSSCRECYLLAHYLARQAVELGYDEARYLAAANLDRYLVFSDQIQKYGTYYNVDSIGRWYLFPIDSLTTDSDRARWDVPPLEDLIRRIDRMNSESEK